MGSPAQVGISAAAFSGDAIAAPGDLKAATTIWRESARPLLPAGNSNPSLPGEIDPKPRFTGLAVASVDREGVTDALSARRGWLTNRPGLWLTLRATSDEDSQWMGEEMPGANEITLAIDYGDMAGEPAGLTLWQDGQPVRHLTEPSHGGLWMVSLPAIPGSVLFAAATQPDGDFAVTAPLLVQTDPSASVLISEVMPAPGRDYNSDGLIDNDDEYIELHNSGLLPVSLAGWQLTDRRGDETSSRRFTFGAGRHISGGEWLLLWRSETYINLDNADDYVRLLNPAGEEVDSVSWTLATSVGSISRPSPESDWQTESVVTPGGAYGGQTGTGTPVIETIDPTEGQVGGPPGSVAAAKRQGLDRWVEFEAIVIAPPGLFNSAIYVADPALNVNGSMAGIGIQVYLRNGEYPPLEQGDHVRVRGMTKSFRGEMEVYLENREQIWRLDGGLPLQPLSVSPGEINESLEGRLVTFSGMVTGWQGDSIYLGDPDDANVEPVRVTVRSSLDWKRPYVNEGERFTVIGIATQFAKAKPWNGGYRVLVRYPEDLVRLAK